MMREILLLLALAQAPSADHAGVDAVAGAASLRGRPVLDAEGAVLGHVERVTAGPDGKPGQLLVRPKGLQAGGPRSVAFAAVTVTGKGLQTPLTKAEFAAMPAVAPQGE